MTKMIFFLLIKTRNGYRFYLQFPLNFYRAMQCRVRYAVTSRPSVRLFACDVGVPRSYNNYTNNVSTQSSLPGVTGSKNHRSAQRGYHPEISGGIGVGVDLTSHL